MDRGRTRCPVLFIFFMFRYFLFDSIISFTIDIPKIHTLYNNFDFLLTSYFTSSFLCFAFTHTFFLFSFFFSLDVKHRLLTP